jgi:CelD/BcsL family acetyltransferase involved in cellulose biosynthesis
MQVVVHDNADAIATLADEWRKLADADPSATVFHSPEFAEAWCSEFGEGRVLRITEIRDGTALVGLAPLSLEDDGVLRFLGDLETTDYLGPVSRMEDRDAVAAEIAKEIRSSPDWRLCELHGLAETSGWPKALAEAFGAAGTTVESQVQERCPRIALPSSYDEYLASLPGKLRHEIRRKARRLERAVGELAIRISDRGSLERDLDTFFALHRSSQGPKGKFLHEGMASFFTRLAQTLTTLGDMRLVLLEAAGRALAGAYCFIDRGTWAMYNSAFDHAHRELAPGMVLVGESIRLAVEAGCDTFDFLRGSEEYKYRFGAVDLPLIQLTLQRPSTE